ncbi:MAG: hypothetical protein DRP95_03310 [Candidatus Latescibacterota bacterium]|nr:MAG: hypothetical protein DRP95_03310 [Candidatus Latescibacterota bacterium]
MKKGLFYLAAVLTFFLTAEAYGKVYRYMLGGGSGDPWDEVANPDETNLVGYTRFPGSLEPLWTDSTFNLAKGVYERGGKIIIGHEFGARPEEMKKVIDGKARALENIFEYIVDPRVHQRIDAKMDLGGQFMVASIRFYTRIVKEGPDPSKFPEGYLFSSNYMQQYEIYINDGSKESRDAYGRIIWTLAEKNDENRSGYVRVDFDPPRLVRHIRILPGYQTKWEIAEWEVYGDGYVPDALYTTKLLDVRELSGGKLDEASWGYIGWGGVNVTDPEARLFIRTRTGDDDTPYVYWRKTGYGTEVPFWEDGEEITEEEYYGRRYHIYPDGRKEKLELRERGKITPDYEHWSPWSAFYPFEEGLKPGGTRITSPGPRRYIQIQVHFLPSRLDGGRIDSLWFSFSEAVAQNVVAELDTAEVGLGTTPKFTYAIRGEFGGGGFVGYDRLRVQTPFRPEILEVRLGGQVVPDAVDTVYAGGFVVKFPKVDRDDRVLEVDFRCPVLRYGVEFPGWVWASGEEVVEQRVNPGDAVAGWGSNTLTVRTSVEELLLDEVEVTPSVATPNGDGVADVVRFEFTVLHLTTPAEVLVGVYDLKGGLVREVYSGTLGSGQYRYGWDGRDEDGELVPPGVYLYRISVCADAKTEERTGALTVVY